MPVEPPRHLSRSVKQFCCKTRSPRDGTKRAQSQTYVTLAAATTSTAAAHNLRAIDDICARRQFPQVLIVRTRLPHQSPYSKLRLRRRTMPHAPVAVMVAVGSVGSRDAPVARAVAVASACNNKRRPHSGEVLALRRNAALALQCNTHIALASLVYNNSTHPYEWSRH